MRRGRIEPRARVLALAWASFALACVAPETRPVYPGPHIAATQAIHDFGTVRPGQTVQHTFSISNYGNQPLTLETDRQACGCVSAVGPSGTVGAGEDAWINVVLDTSGPPGARSRSAIVRTNDPAQPEVAFTLIGKVTADIAAEPPVLFFGRLPPGVTLTKSVQVSAIEGVNVESVSRDNRALELSIDRLAPPQRGVRIDVTLLTPPERGRFVAWLRVKTTSPHQPEVEIPVLASVE